jgi:predicted alpha/beta superfamily hydrolase
VSGSRLKQHERFRSRFLRNQRDIIVYLPAGYDDQSSRRFPILYMHDGQNLFDRATAFGGVDWNVHGAADRLIEGGSIQPLVIVGIYNIGKSRINEYTPTKSRKLGGGRADRYAKFLLQELMPFIESEYRVSQAPSFRGIGGSSLGGLVSLYIGLQNPRVFGKIAALSPSLWWDQRAILRFAERVNPEPRPRIWLDIGTREGPRIVPEVERFRDILIKKGWRLGEDLHYQLVEGAEHNEAAWSARVAPFLQFLYSALDSP